MARTGEPCDLGGSIERLEVETLLLIVVGADLRAEIADRPLADELRERIGRWQREHADRSPLQAVVCTDLWYLNAEELHARPAISIREPGLNAATAYLAARLPTAYVVEQTLRVQLDPELLDLRACLWGTDRAATAASVEVFAERYLDAFLDSAHL